HRGNQRVEETDMPAKSDRWTRSKRRFVHRIEFDLDAEELLCTARQHPDRPRLDPLVASLRGPLIESRSEPRRDPQRARSEDLERGVKKVLTHKQVNAQ